MTQLSIGITAHSEGITLHKTLLSVAAATRQLEKQSVSYEILLQLDNPSQATLDYSKNIPELFPELPMTLSLSTFGNPSESRNDIVERATGKYITFIDGDDLVSREWFIKALKFLEKSEKGALSYVAHPEVVMEFGESSSIIKRYGEIDFASDTLLSVFANRWNVVLMIQRQFLIDNPYPTKKGYGFEDWYINCLAINQGLHNILIPETALFVRRKREDSVWLTHQSDFAVLPANPLLSFANIHTVVTPEKISSHKIASTSHIKDRVKKIRLARIAMKLLKKIHPPQIHQQAVELPAWLQEERRALYRLDKTISPFDAPTAYDSLTQEHYASAALYKALIDTLPYTSYGYIIFAPWLIKGGADLFTLNYANSIADAAPNRKVLLITTLPVDSPWSSRLSKNVSLLEFGSITQGQPGSVTNRLLEHIVENSGATHLHVINSELGYTFIEQHKKYLAATSKTVTSTSFSQSTDDTGRIFGYSHTHVPVIYNSTSLITTDNTPVRDMWIEEYGFDSNKILVHNQPVALPQDYARPNQQPSGQDPLNVLWAARLSPEKQPEIVSRIAKKLSDKPIHFHMYGQPDDNFDTSFTSNLPANVTYHGPFDGFDSLKPESFDVYLYTSLFDGMPNSILEAASYGLPIVASRVGGIPSLIESGTDGFLVDNLEDDKEYVQYIESLLQNTALLERFGVAIRAKIETDFSEASYKKQITKMLKKVGYL